jgi:hypothetical protein
MHRMPHSGPESAQKSSPLGPDDPGLKTASARKTEALLASRVVQFNSYSCSAAAVATVVNAIRRISSPPGLFRALSQQEVLRRVDCHHWRERVSDQGYRGSHGMPLLEFGEAVQAALSACRIFAARVQTVEIRPEMGDLEVRKKRLQRVLRALTEEPGDFLIAHFTQGEYFGDWYGGHISPVGAYDNRSERVLVLDVDPECPTPYWVSLDRFFEGLLGRSKVIGRPGGGYVRIELKRFKIG